MDLSVVFKCRLCTRLFLAKDKLNDHVVQAHNVKSEKVAASPSNDSKVKPKKKNVPKGGFRSSEASVSGDAEKSKSREKKKKLVDDNDRRKKRNADREEEADHAEKTSKKRKKSSANDTDLDEDYVPETKVSSSPSPKKKSRLSRKRPEKAGHSKKRKERSSKTSSEYSEKDELPSTSTKEKKKKKRPRSERSMSEESEEKSTILDKIFRSNASTDEENMEHEERKGRKKKEARLSQTAHEDKVRKKRENEEKPLRRNGRPSGKSKKKDRSDKEKNEDDGETTQGEEMEEDVKKNGKHEKKKLKRLNSSGDDRRVNARNSEHDRRRKDRKKKHLRDAETSTDELPALSSVAVSFGWTDAGPSTSPTPTEDFHLFETEERSSTVTLPLHAPSYSAVSTANLEFGSRDSLLSEGQVSDALSALKSPQQSPQLQIPGEVGDDTVQEARQAVIKLVREPCNDITITPKPYGKVEILYTGEKPNLEIPENSPKPQRREYSEWRCELVERFTRGKIPRKSQAQLSKEEEVSFSLPRSSLQIVNVYGLKDDIHAILDVLTGQKMTTITLDGYLMLKTEELATSLPVAGRPNYVFLPSMFLPVFKKTQDVDAIQPNMIFFPHENLRDSVIVAPILSCRHFYLTIIDIPNETVYVYDSSWRFLPMEHRFFHVKALLKIILSWNMPDPYVRKQSWKIKFEKDCAQQIDEHSCGCYVMYFAENHIRVKPSRNEKPLTASDVKSIRQDVAKKLLATTNIGKQILDTICY